MAFPKWIPPPSPVINLVLAVQSDQVQMIAGIFGFTAWFSTEIKMSQSNSWPAGTLKLRLGSFHSVCCVLYVWECVCVCFRHATWSLSGSVCVCSFMHSLWTLCDRFRKINLKRLHYLTGCLLCSKQKSFQVLRLHIWCGVRSITSSYVIGKPVMIVTEYMENGSLDTFLRVSKCITQLQHTMDFNALPRQQRNPPEHWGMKTSFLVSNILTGVYQLTQSTGRSYLALKSQCLVNVE